MTKENIKKIKIGMAMQGIKNQRELAKQVEADEATVSLWMKGHRPPSKSNMEKLEKVLKIKL